MSAAPGERAVCAGCGRPVTRDETAVTRKLINRGTTTWFCVDCLARRFEVEPEDILERIAYFRRMGCTLFLPEGEEDRTLEEGKTPCVNA